MANIDVILKHLAGENEANSALACATLCMLLADEKSATLNLEGIASRLLELLQDAKDVDLKRNSTAALSAVIECSETAIEEVLQNNGATVLVEQLHEALAIENDPNMCLAVNLTVAIGALADSGIDGSKAVLQAKALQPLLTAAGVCQPGILQEAATDSLCKVMVNSGKEQRDQAVNEGILEAMVNLLAVDQSIDSEARVRALMVIGMMTGADSAQNHLASIPNASSSLLALSKNEDDADAQVIARDLIALLEERGGM